MPVIVSKKQLVEQLRNLGIEQGDLLNLKVSMSSIGYIENGARTLLEALLEAVGQRGTIEAQAFIDCYPLPLSSEHAKAVSDRYSFSYAGAIPNAMIWHPDCHCSTHPIQRFAFIGYRAREFAQGHIPESYAYEPLQWMSLMNAKSLKIGTDEKVAGVGTTHVATGILGFRKMERELGINYYDYRDGRIKLFKRNWVTICPPLFLKFVPLYYEQGAILTEGKIGEARAIVTSMAKTLQIEIATLRAKPEFVFCNNPRCYQCKVTWEHSPMTAEQFKLSNTPYAIANKLKARLRLR